MLEKSILCAYDLEKGKQFMNLKRNKVIRNKVIIDFWKADSFSFLTTRLYLLLYLYVSVSLL